MAEEPVSPITTTKPELTISAPALNSEPVELDGTPTSPHQLSKQDEPSAEDQEKRAQLISERKGDKGVLVDIPQTPSAEEFGRSEDAEASVSSQTSETSSS